MANFFNTVLGGLSVGLNVLNTIDQFIPGAQIPGNSDFNIDQFRTHFANHLEVSKSDKFDVYIYLPQAVAQAVSTQDLSLQCEVSELPGKDINMIEFRHYGFIKRIPHINQYNAITFTFICAGDLFEKMLFDRWMDYMLPAQTGIIQYPQDASGAFLYQSQIDINQRDMFNNIAYTVSLYNALPISISPMAQNWQDDSIHRLSVTFAYEKWLSSETMYTSPPSNLGSTNGSNPTSSNNSTGSVSNFDNTVS